MSQAAALPALHYMKADEDQEPPGNEEVRELSGSRRVRGEHHDPTTGEPDRGECAACGHSNWLWGLEAISIKEQPGDRSHDCLALICSHCGLVRLHAQAVLLSDLP